MKNADQKFKAAAYLRLSKEDAVVDGADKGESNSISNQRALLNDYAASKTDIEIAEYYIDDGFTGALFERPSFQKMMQDIKEDKVNCVIVKDLSRFGREYINAGMFLQRLFPSLGVRFISVNDNYDSLNSDDQTTQIIIPFKNVINDSYCRDISIKIRSVLESKRKSGEFVGNFCAYGYKKCEDDRHKIEPDEYAGGVVQDIFKWIIEGYSLYKIADKLNALGIKTPLDYKLQNGEKINKNFKKHETSAWSHNIVKRIAENPIYIGTLIQGKVTTPNHKVKNKVYKPMEDWAIVEHNHEPLIDEKTFIVVQRLLKLDMRTSPKQDKQFLFAGIAYCGDCGAPMVRKVSTVGSKKYAYYMCSSYKSDKICTSHRLRENVLENRVLEGLTAIMNKLIVAQEIIQSTDISYVNKINVKKLTERIAAYKSEIENNAVMLAEAYTDFKNGLLTQSDFSSIKNQLEIKRDKASKAIAQLNIELAEAEKAENNNYGSDLIEEFKRYHSVKHLTRSMIVYLIRQVKVYEDDMLEIVLDCQDQLQRVLEKAEAIKHSERQAM